METGEFPLQRKLCIDGCIKELSLTIGELRVMCSFAIIGEREEHETRNNWLWSHESLISFHLFAESNRPLMSLGNKTLKSLKVTYLPL